MFDIDIIMFHKSHLDSPRFYDSIQIYKDQYMNLYPIDLNQYRGNLCENVRLDGYHPSGGSHNLSEQPNLDVIRVLSPVIQHNNGERYTQSFNAFFLMSISAHFLM